MAKNRMSFSFCRASAGVLAGLMMSGASANINDAEMVRVPAGYFTMGCNPNLDPVCYYAPDEKKHDVYLDAFKIDKYEVTFRRYQKCMDDKKAKCTPPSVGGAMNYGWEGVDSFPVNGVTWYQAKKFCEFEGKRLPTEAEWEKAARGTDQRTYPWGWRKPSCERAVIDAPNAGELGCKTGNTMNVGSKPKGASPYGAMDMAGNLWEWTADWHSETYYNYSPGYNPKGPALGLYKTTRGGDFFSRNDYEVRSTSRFPYEPSDPSIAVGFRCAK
ncbi:formylglycine-generating enzyme family protein [Endozoicomonas arenosclerae]|uniref:formylglycine-generating enzyme family protein n=1 Tax=Endozoicomonas arenosclerae TaxID=1633495 RepID=UPI0009A1A2A3|nr:formylglycine-generating enzyme family protein [Endozoicomonas arenosclerae]